MSTLKAGEHDQVAEARSARVPRLVDGIDIRALPIGPEEAFVISRIDGHADEIDIANGTGLSEERVQVTLVRLLTLGVIGFTGIAGAVSGKQSIGEEPPVGSRIPTLRSAARSKPAPEEQPDTVRPAPLDAGLQEDIDALDADAHTRNHYKLLGVERSASRSEIKAAYFSMIGRFHPDRHSDKDLALVRPKLERILTRLTDAYDTLARAEPRRVYDATLPAETPTSARCSAALSKPDDSARRQSLARKLRTSSDALRGPCSTTLPAVPAFRPSNARNAVTIPAPMPTSQSRRFLAAADQALEEGNPVAAANSLRIALSITPDDMALKARLENIQRDADATIKDRLAQAARVAEQSGHVGEAMNLYARAARAANDPELFRKAAECATLAGENPRRAAEFVRNGLALAPDEPKLHVELGRIYAEAGMRASALAEFQKAKRWSPENDSISAWIERLEKGDT